MTRHSKKREDPPNAYQIVMRAILAICGVVDASAVAAAIKDPSVLGNTDALHHAATAAGPDPDAALNAHMQQQEVIQQAQPDTTELVANTPVDSPETFLQPQDAQQVASLNTPDLPPAPETDAVASATDITSFNASVPAPHTETSSVMHDSAPADNSLAAKQPEADIAPAAGQNASTAVSANSHLSKFMQDLETKLGPVITDNENVITACAACGTSLAVGGMWLRYARDVENFSRFKDMEDDMEKNHGKLPHTDHKYQQKAEREIAV